MKFFDKITKSNNYQRFKVVSKDKDLKVGYKRFAVSSIIYSSISIICTLSLLLVTTTLSYGNTARLVSSILIFAFGYIFPIILLTLSFTNIIFQLFTNKRLISVFAIFLFALAISLYICLVIYTDIQILFN